MSIRVLLIILLASCSFSSVAETDVTSATALEKKLTLEAIKKWKGFEGVWEGELHYVAAPKQDWYKLRQPVRLILEKSAIKFLVRNEGQDWREVAMSYRSYQPDELTLVVHAYGAQGVWTENNVIVITRRSENEAEVYVQRVVNNWAGKALPGEDLIYGDSRAGNVKRQSGT